MKFGFLHARGLGTIFMKQKITLKKIAKEFGVSISTVSKALKDSHEISLEVKERIQAFAKYYHYKPNSLALNLRNQKTKTIGVIIPEIVHHFFTKVITGRSLSARRCLFYGKQVKARANQAGK